MPAELLDRLLHSPGRVVGGRIPEGHVSRPMGQRPAVFTRVPERGDHWEVPVVRRSRKVIVGTVPGVDLKGDPVGHHGKKAKKAHGKKASKARIVELEAANQDLLTELAKEIQRANGLEAQVDRLSARLDVVEPALRSICRVRRSTPEDARTMREIAREALDRPSRRSA